MQLNTRVWGDPVDGCRISASVVSSKIPAGQPVVLTVVLRNDGQREARFARLSKWFEYDYTITVADGQSVPLTRFGQQQRRFTEVGGPAVLQELEPGQEVVSKVEISRLYDLTLSDRYVIEASKALLSQNGQGSVKVASNRVDFEITDGQ